MLNSSYWENIGSAYGLPNLDRAVFADLDLVAGLDRLHEFVTEQVDAAAFMAAMVQFEREVQDAVVDHGGTVVKLIGDEVMFATPDPVSAVRVAAALVGIGRDIPGLDGMRVGLAYGQVIRSGGDFYGTVVNTAARIVGQAYPDAIVATQRVVDALRAHERASDPPGQVCETQPLGPHDLRGIQQPVELYRLRP